LPTTYGLSDLGTATLLEAYDITNDIAVIRAKKVNIGGAIIDGTLASIKVAKATIIADGANAKILAQSALRLRAGELSASNIEIGDINGLSTWDKGHIVFGAYHLWIDTKGVARSEEHTSELQSLRHLVFSLHLEKNKETLTS